MGNVTTVFASDDKDVQRAFASMQKEMIRLREQNKQLVDQTKEAKRANDEYFDFGVAGLAKMAAGYLTLSSGISAVIDKLKEEKQLRRELEQQSADATVRRADAQAGFIRNAGDVSPQELARLKSQMIAISRETGVDTNALFRAGGSGLSAGAAAGLSNAQSVASLRIAAMAAPDDETTLQDLSGGLLDIASLTGSSDPRKNFGLIAGTAARSRVKDIGKLAATLVPSAIGIAKQGGSAEEALAIVATLSDIRKDSQGALSATMGTNLVEKLKEFKPTAGLASPMERIRALQADPMMAAAFMQQAAFGAEQVGTIRGLLSNPRNAELLSENLRMIPSEDAVAFGDRMIANIQNQPEQQLARAKRRMAVGVEEAAIGDSGKAWTGAIQPELLKALKQSGLSGGAAEAAAGGGALWFDSDLQEMVSGGVDPREAALRILRGRRLQLTKGRVRGGGGMATLGNMEAFDAAGRLEERSTPLSEDEQRQLKDLDGAIRDLSDAVRAGGATPVINPEANTEGR